MVVTVMRKAARATRGVTTWSRGRVTSLVTWTNELVDNVQPSLHMQPDFSEVLIIQLAYSISTIAWATSMRAWCTAKTRRWVLRAAQHGNLEELIISTQSARVVLFAIKFTVVQSLSALFIHFWSNYSNLQWQQKFHEYPMMLKQFALGYDLDDPVPVCPSTMSFIYIGLVHPVAHKPYPFFCREDKTFL